MIAFYHIVPYSRMCYCLQRAAAAAAAICSGFDITNRSDCAAAHTHTYLLYAYIRYCTCKYIRIYMPKWNDFECMCGIYTRAAFS